MTTYGIIIYSDRGEISFPLTARTDNGARRQWRQWLKDNVLKSGQAAFLQYYKDDGTVWSLESKNNGY